MFTRRCDILSLIKYKKPSLVSMARMRSHVIAINFRYRAKAEIDDGREVY